ncbi:uncharacterized protein LOC112182578 [Rosa chinensis]|uniref:uncharacterized protein LOC112182578 n=1 Tax=Rosa chinensis TaxID=74649 RepID=UPI000D087F15|nr:uncharacterized protein LOC112182578 [Rosa chinensis]
MLALMEKEAGMLARMDTAREMETGGPAGGAFGVTSFTNFFPKERDFKKRIACGAFSSGIAAGAVKCIGTPCREEEENGIRRSRMECLLTIKGIELNKGSKNKETLEMFLLAIRCSANLKK